jgi:pyruvate, water dikinase
MLIALEGKSVAAELVGNKAYNLNKVLQQGYKTPNGFVISSQIYNEFVNPFRDQIANVLQKQKDPFIASNRIIELLNYHPLPPLVSDLSSVPYMSLAVRSSAVKEDTLKASFAGVFHSELNVSPKNFEASVRKVYASLYSPSAIINGATAIDTMAILVQRMLVGGVFGICFTEHPDGLGGFGHVATNLQNGSDLVQGKTNGSEYIFKKQSLVVEAIQSGSKEEKKAVESCVRTFSLLEEKFGKPLDIEWCYLEGQLYILQVRPITTHVEDFNPHFNYPDNPILIGAGIGTTSIDGEVQIIDSIEDAHHFREGRILVVEDTSPEWEPLMKKACGLITDNGSRTSHAAIRAREMNLPAIVGVESATKDLKDFQNVVLVPPLGAVYDGHKI